MQRFINVVHFKRRPSNLIDAEDSSAKLVAARPNLDAAEKNQFAVYRNW